jgi:hypothetical protein
VPALEVLGEPAIEVACVPALVDAGALAPLVPPMPAFEVPGEPAIEAACAPATPACAGEPAPALGVMRAVMPPPPAAFGRAFAALPPLPAVVLAALAPPTVGGLTPVVPPAVVSAEAEDGFAASEHARSVATAQPQAVRSRVARASVRSVIS